MSTDWKRQRGLAGSAARDKIVSQAVDKEVPKISFVRRIAARAGTAKRIILQTIAPELLDLKVRHEALERVVLSYMTIHAHDPAGVPGFEPRLPEMREKVRAELHEKDRLKHLAGPDADSVWKGIEDKMVVGLRAKAHDRIVKALFTPKTKDTPK